MLPEDAPLWQRHFHGDGYGYGWLLCLIGVSLMFQMAAPDASWARVVTILLQGFTLIAALTVSGVRRWLVEIAVAVAAVAFLGVLGLAIGPGDYDTHGGSALGLLLVVLTPAAILRGIIVQARRSGQITIRTMFGVLCVYLLIGTAFSFAFATISAFEDGTFFAQTSSPDQSDFLYFSLSTMTTTGFGDFTAAHDLGRSLAILEALIGQIYLVTLVALIVGNLGRPSLPR
jgi:hypothetical protein